MWTLEPDWPAFVRVMFQSLSRDSVHVDLMPATKRMFSIMFQSLSRDSVHVDRRSLCLADLYVNSFNPSVGIPSMWTDGASAWRTCM